MQAFAFAFEQRVKNGQVLAGEKTTLQEFAQRWLTEYAQVQLEAGTLEKYRYELEVKILPALGHRKLSEIKPHHLNAFYLSLTRDGARQDGKKGGYAPPPSTRLMWSFPPCSAPPWSGRFWTATLAVP